MKIYIGVPLYGGAEGEFLSSLLKLRVVLEKCGYIVETDIHQGCSVISKARNDIVSRFLQSGFDYLLFLDSDLQFSPVPIIRLIQAGHKVSACVYRNKSQKEVYHCVVLEDDGDWLKCDRAGTGVMLIHRSVFDEMKSGDIEYYDNGELRHAFFDFAIINKQYWGEDYNFCRKWVELGGKIHVFADADITHIGKFPYKGNIRAYLDKKGEDNAP